MDENFAVFIFTNHENKSYDTDEQTGLLEYNVNLFFNTSPTMVSSLCLLDLPLFLLWNKWRNKINQTRSLTMLGERCIFTSAPQQTNG